MKSVLAKSACQGLSVMHAEREPVLGIGAGERIHDVEVACLQMRDDLLAKAVELLLLQRLVDLAPVDPLLGARLANDEAVLGSGLCALPCRP